MGGFLFPSCLFNKFLGSWFSLNPCLSVPGCVVLGFNLFSIPVEDTRSVRWAHSSHKSRLGCCVALRSLTCIFAHAGKISIPYTALLFHLFPSSTILRALQVHVFLRPSTFPPCPVPAMSARGGWPGLQTKRCGCGGIDFGIGTKEKRYAPSLSR